MGIIQRPAPVSSLMHLPDRTQVLRSIKTLNEFPARCFEQAGPTMCGLDSEDEAKEM